MKSSISDIQNHLHEHYESKSDIWLLIYTLYVYIQISFLYLCIYVVSKLYRMLSGYHLPSKILRLRRSFIRFVRHHVWRNYHKAQIKKSVQKRNKSRQSIYYRLCKYLYENIRNYYFVEVETLIILIEIHLDRNHQHLARIINKSINRKKIIDQNMYYIYGCSLALQGNWLNAAKYFEYAINMGLHSANVYYYLGVSLDLQGKYGEAMSAYAAALGKSPKWTQAMVNLAYMKLYCGLEDEAVKLLQQAIRLDARYGMAHQNTAALYDRDNYYPTDLDKAAIKELVLYDACNYVGERSIHAGDGLRGIQLFGRALQIQREISVNFKLPFNLIDRIRSVGKYEAKLPIRILPYEWVTQIGHIAMLDTYVKMQLLGYAPIVNRLLLAPEHKVANQSYLEYWRPYFIIITDKELVDKLFQYQRYIGDCFNGFLEPDGTALSWPDKGALAHLNWDSLGHGPLLKLNDADKAWGREVLEKLGVPRDAWFVGLHVRESGFHHEGAFSTQKHRNAPIENYLPAIRYIVQQGGYVIRMGDPSMQPVKPEKGLIEYALSEQKSDRMDIFLCSESRFFLGTTSGLTNVVISFNTPCMLVNCISNFSQLWNRNVKFIHKICWSHTQNRYLKLEEIIDDNFRWKLMSSKTIEEEGIEVYNNNADDILLAVMDMLDPVNTASTGNHEYAKVIKLYNNVVSDNHRFGNANPGLRFFNKHQDVFF